MHLKSCTQRGPGGHQEHKREKGRHFALSSTGRAGSADVHCREAQKMNMTQPGKLRDLETMNSQSQRGGPWLL